MQTFPSQCIQTFIQSDISVLPATSTSSASPIHPLPSIPALPVLLSGSIQSSLTSAQLQPTRATLRKRRETTGNTSNQSDGKDADNPVVVEVPANDATRTGTCSRTLCCNSFQVASDDDPSSSSSSLSSSKRTLTLYWCPHRVEKQHFEMPQSDVERELRARLSHVDDELHELQQKKQRVDHHIKVLHDYNEIKDVVQALMGKCAEMEGATTKDMYEKFGLNLDD